VYFTINILLVENTLQNTLRYFTDLSKSGKTGKKQKMLRILGLHRFLAFWLKMGILSLKYFTVVPATLK